MDPRRHPQRAIEDLASEVVERRAYMLRSYSVPKRKKVTREGASWNWRVRGEGAG
jgi:hypothetical protein